MGGAGGRNGVGIALQHQGTTRKARYLGPPGAAGASPGKTVVHRLHYLVFNIIYNCLILKLEIPSKLRINRGGVFGRIGTAHRMMTFVSPINNKKRQRKAANAKRTQFYQNRKSQMLANKNVQQQQREKRDV